MSINERLVLLLRRLAHTNRTALDLLLAAAIVGIIGAVVFGTAAHAQAPCPATPACEPTSQPDRNLCGPELRGRTDVGEWAAFWWKDGTRWCAYSWAGLYKFAPGPRALMQIVDSIRANPGPAAIMQAITQHTVVPAPGSQDEFDFKTLRRAACMALAAAPMAGQTATCTMVAPTPPAATAPQYVVTSTTLHPITAAGARGAALASPKATLGQACDCAARKITNPYGGQYCAVAVPNASGPLVAGCSLKK